MVKTSSKGYSTGFNHLAVRGWFRLQTHKPAWLCGKPGFKFLKNIYYVSFYHSYKYSLAHLSRNVNRFPAKKAAWLSPPPARNGRSVIRIGIDDRGSDSSGSADDGGKYACTHENHLLNVESEKNHQKMPQRSGESSRRGSGFMILLMVSPPFTIYIPEKLNFLSFITSFHENKPDQSRHAGSAAASKIARIIVPRTEIMNITSIY